MPACNPSCSAALAGEVPEDRGCHASTCVPAFCTLMLIDGAQGWLKGAEIPEKNHDVHAKGYGGGQ